MTEAAPAAPALVPTPSAASAAPVVSPAASASTAEAVPSPSAPLSGAGDQGQSALASPAAQAGSVSPAAEAAPVVAPAETTVLGTPPVVPAPEAVKPPEAAPVEGAPVEGEKKEGDQSAEPAPLPSYDAFTLPEGFTVEQERIETFTKLLGEFETVTKADHAEMQKFGQQLMDRHIAEVQSAVDAVQKSYAEHWTKTKNEWRDSFMKDPEIGGNRYETTINSAVEFIHTHGGNEQQQTEFRKLMDDTGLGNHPALIRMFANANAHYQEGRPLPAQSPIPAPKSKLQAFYGKRA